METEEKILEFSYKTFPNITIEATKAKLKEETLELLEAICRGNIHEIIEESADVRIVGTRLAKDSGSSFDMITDLKVIENNTRLWKEEESNGDRTRDKEIKYNFLHKMIVDLISSPVGIVPVSVRDNFPEFKL